MRKPLTLDSPGSLEMCIQRLAQEADEKEFTVFSLSGFKGNRDVLYQLKGTDFVVQKRRRWRNDFAPQFFGQFISSGAATRIEGYFNSPVWSRIFMWIWLAMVATTGLPIFFSTLLRVTSGHNSASESDWVGLLVPPGMFAFGLLLPKVGRTLRRSEETYLKSFLEQTFGGCLRESRTAIRHCVPFIASEPLAKFREIRLYTLP